MGDDSPDLISLYNKQHGSSMPTQELRPLPMLISNRSLGLLQDSSFRLWVHTSEPRWIRF